MDKVEIQDFRTGMVFETSQAGADGVKERLDFYADRQDWLQIYCAVIGRESVAFDVEDFEIETSPEIVAATDKLFEAYKNRWG